MKEITSVNQGNRRPQTTYLRQGRRIWSGSPVRTVDPDFASGLPPKFDGDFLVQGYLCDKISLKIRSLSPEIWVMLWKNAPSGIVETNP